MRRTAKCVLATIGLVVLAACGGGEGSNDPADAYAGAWKSACFPYTGNDGYIYFQTRSFTLRKESPTSLKGKHSDTVAFADSACTIVLGPISNYPDVTIELGPKSNVLGGEADSITLTEPSRTYPGYMKVSGAQLFLVLTDDAKTPPISWGRASPHSRLEPRMATLSQAAGSGPTAKSTSPRPPMEGFLP